MKLSTRSVVVMAFSLTAPAALCLDCYAVTSQGTTRTRAVNDFNCPAEQIEVKDIGGHSHRAIGCGHDAVYNCIPDQNMQFTCILERERTPAQPAQ